jgi:hypothetical protein
MDITKAEGLGMEKFSDTQLIGELAARLAAQSEPKG